MKMKMRFVRIGGLAALAIGLLGGCGAPDSAVLGGVDESLGQTSAPLTTSWFTLRNFASGLCLGTSGGHSDLRTAVVSSTCDLSPSQSWEQALPMTDDPTYFQLLNAVAANRCLDNYGYAGSNGNYYYPTDIAGCQTTFAGVKPIFVSYDESDHECYRFSADLVHSFVLGPLNGSRAKGAAVVYSLDFNNISQHPDQLWCVYPAPAPPPPPPPPH
jgi:hypothetical protein